MRKSKTYTHTLSTFTCVAVTSFEKCLPLHRGLPTTPIPSLTTADVALASKFSRRSSLSFAPLPLTIPLRQRKNSAPTKAPNPFLSHLNLNAIGDSSDSDDPTFIKPSPATHRRTQSLFSGKPKKSASVLDNPTPKGVVPRKPYM